MNELLPPWLDPRRQYAPALLVFVVGFALHAIDQVANPRAGPVPVLVTAPLVACLAYVAASAQVDRRRFGFLVLWSFVGTGLALLAVVAVATTEYLPRALADPEQVLWDTALFVWFVVALALPYAVAARWDGRKASALIVAGPVLQALYAGLLALLVRYGVYG